MIPILSVIQSKPAKVTAGLSAAALAIWFVSSKIKKAREETAADNARSILGENTKEGKAVTYATLLRTAMKGWGTKEKAIYQVMSESKAAGLAFGNLSSAYKTTYQRDLLEDLQKELNNREYAKFIASLGMIQGNFQPQLNINDLI